MMNRGLYSAISFIRTSFKHQLTSHRWSKNGTFSQNIQHLTSGQNQPDNKDAANDASIETENVYQYLKTEWKKSKIQEPFVKDSVISVINMLISATCPQDKLGNFILKNARLLKRPIQHWEESLHVFTGYGFNGSQILRLYAACAEKLPSKSVLIDRINVIRSIGITDDQIHQFLNNRPKLLLIDSKEILHRYRELQMLFPKNTLMKMIVRSPNLLHHPFTMNEAKYKYIIEEMGLNDRDISFSSVFNQSLDHIRTRHTILVRLGVYEKPNEKGITKKIQNSRLRKIVDTEDLVFCRKVANVELADYLCFKNLLESELDVDTDSDSDVDSDVDDS